MLYEHFSSGLPQLHLDNTHHWDIAMCLGNPTVHIIIIQCSVYFLSLGWEAFPIAPRSLFLALVARLLAKSADVILARPGGRREREVGKTELRASWEQRLSIKCVHCSNFCGMLERGREKRERRERGREGRGRGN
jgi:hypothetical protein